jgi:hypothetical protein
MKLYRLEYQMHIGNGPEEGYYPQLAGYTIRKEKAEAHVAERPDNHSFMEVPMNQLQDALDLDKDEREEFDAWERAEIKRAYGKQTSSNFVAMAAREIGGAL